MSAFSLSCYVCVCFALSDSFSRLQLFTGTTVAVPTFAFTPYSPNIQQELLT